MKLQRTNCKGSLKEGTFIDTYLNPLARFPVALIFILSGVGKVFGFTQTAAIMESVGFPASSLFLAGAILLEIVGGVLLVVGYKARLGSLALIGFLIPATLIFHAANLGDQAQGQQQMIEVLKNLAILGALLKFMVDGAGAYALDNVLAGRKLTRESAALPNRVLDLPSRSAGGHAVAVGID